MGSIDKYKEFDSKCLINTMRLIQNKIISGYLIKILVNVYTNNRMLYKTQRANILTVPISQGIRWAIR